jgi:hypothetical protein
MMYFFFFGARNSICLVYSDIRAGTIISTFEDSKPNHKVRPCSLLPDILTGIALLESS